MKRRLLTWVLAVAMTIGLLPTVALANGGTAAIDSSAKTVTIGGTAYTMSLGQRTQKQDGTLGYWLDKVDRGFITEGATNEFRYYLFLRNSNTEASAEVYKQFWTECTASAVYQIDADTEPVNVTAEDYDEAYKYFPVSVTGEQSGKLSVTITHNDTACTLSQTFQYTQATELTSNNGTYTISIPDAAAKQSYFYYIDLGTSKKVSVSGSLTDVSTGRLVLAQKAEGESESELWQDSTTYTRTVTTDKLLLRVVSNAGGTFSGSVTVKEVSSGDGDQTPDDGSQSGLPDYGFYSSNQRSTETLLSEVTLTDAADDLTAIYFIGKNELKTSESDTFTVTAGDAAITSEYFEFVDDYTLKITLPGDSYGSMYYIGVQRNGSNLAGIKVTGPNGGNEGGNTENPYNVPELPIATSDFYDSQTRDLNDKLSHAYWRCLQEGSGDYRAIYYVTENGFTEAEKATVTVSAEAGITPSAGFLPYEWLARENGNYDLKISLSQLNYTDQSMVHNNLPYNVIVKKDGTAISAIRVDWSLSGSNYQASNGLVIGFAKISESGAVQMTDVLGGQGNYKGNGDYDYRTDATLVAATGNYNEGWKLDETVTQSLKITKLEIVNINGDPETFSWSPESYVSTLSNVSGRSVPLYVKAGKVAQSMVKATVTGEIGGKTIEATVTSALHVYFLNGIVEQRPKNDTVDALNAFLETWAKDVDPEAVSGNIYKVYLDDTTYTGTIVLPEEFQDWNILHLYGASGAGEKTIVQGGIDLNTARVENLEDIHFIAAEGGTTKALYGSAVRTMSNCSFYGYDVAVDSSNGVINAKGGNVFVNNEVAILVDLKEVSPGTNGLNLSADEWFDNTFINNATAVKILSLNEKIRQFYFRVTNSNFINNGTDFYASCGGTLYMYNNYYGQYKLVNDSRPMPGKHHADRNNGREHLHLEALLNATTLAAIADILDIGGENDGRFVSAKVTASNDTTVITNSRWKYPVKRWWGCENVLIEDVFFPAADSSSGGGVSAQADETEYVNIPVIDPKQKTRIVNDESADLLIDGSVFDAADANNDAIQMEVVELVDSAEVTVGTWNFD